LQQGFISREKSKRCINGKITCDGSFSPPEPLLQSRRMTRPGLRKVHPEVHPEKILLLSGYNSAIRV
jgi:hypothetical protein